MGDERRISEKQRGRRDIRRRRTYERQKGVINHFMRYESNACKKNGSRGSMILVTQSKHIHVLCKEGIDVLILYLD